MGPIKYTYCRAFLINTRKCLYSMTNNNEKLAKILVEQKPYPKLIAFELFERNISPFICNSQDKNRIWNIIKNEQISLVQNIMTQLYISHILNNFGTKDLSFLYDAYNHLHNEIINISDKFAEMHIQKITEGSSIDLEKKILHLHFALEEMTHSLQQLLDTNEKKIIAKELLYKEQSKLLPIIEKSKQMISFDSFKMILNNLSIEHFPKD